MITECVNDNRISWEPEVADPVPNFQTDVFQTLHDSYLCLTAVLRVWCDRLASLAVPCVGGNAFWLHYSVLSTCEALTTWYTPSTRCKSCPVLGV